MSRHPTWSYPVDSETLTLLAWFSSLDFRTMLEQLQQEPSCHLLEEAMQVRLDETLTCLQGFPLYGPALVQLVRYRIALVNLSRVASAIAIEEVIEPSNALFFSDQPYRSSAGHAGGASEPVDETEVFCEAVTSHAPLAEYLRQWSQSWGGNVCRGARGLQAFFTAYPRFALVDAPFFVRELLRMSLEQVNWHRVAALLLGVMPPVCECASGAHRTDPVTQVALLEEALQLVGCTIERLVPGLPDPQRDQALFLADLCKHTATAMRQVDLQCL